MKPPLAENWEPSKVEKLLPLWQLPKIDGVRGMGITKQFTGRSLKPFKNQALTAFWSQPQFQYLDGELVMPGEPWNIDRLCSMTTGLCNRVKDIAVPDFCVFDYLHPDLIAKGATYADRYDALSELIVTRLDDYQEHGVIRLVPFIEVNSIAQIEAKDSEYLDDNLEGSILRNHRLPLKEGRSTQAAEYWRIKRFIDCEARCTGLVEAQENQNEAKTNALGRTERSSHKENMVGKNMVGMLECVFDEDVIYNGEVLFPKGMEIKVGPGEMDHAERSHYWHHPEEIVGQLVKFQTFPKGVKTKPRMPGFKSLRATEDMS